jgi:lysophospholipase L1-like esterase
MAQVTAARKNSLAAPSLSRRSLLWSGAAGLALAGCAQSDARALGMGGPYRSLREMAGWNPANAARSPMVQEAAWTGEPLLPLRRGLAEVQRGRRRSPVSIVQFGDSHTMSPALVPRLRELFQSRYGALGPGRLAPGNGPRFSRPALVQTEQQGDWQGSSALRTPGAFSLPGYRLRGEAPGSRVVLRSTEEAGFDKFQLELLMQPGGGSFRLLVDGQAGPRLPSAGNATRHVPLVYEPPQRHREVAIELLGDGPVELLGWGMERKGPGVLVEGFGLNGATIDLLYNLDQGMLRDGLAGRNPALVILAFGTNEAVSPRTTREAYASQLTERVRTIRRMAPGSGVLIMGAPDAAKRSGGRGQGCSAWEALPALAEVRAAQRQVARSENCAFWDWGSVTGGVCGLHNGTRSNPRLVQDDHIHFTADGYRLTAERLFAYLTGQGVA